MFTYHQRTHRQNKLQTLKKFRVSCWIEVVAPSPSEIEVLSKTYKLDAGHLQDALDPYEVPRVEREKNILYIFFRFPIMGGTEITTQPCLFILAPTFFATVAAQEYLVLDILKKHLQLNTSQKTKAMVLLLMGVLSTYHQTLNFISKQVNASLGKLENISNKDIITLIKHERSANEMMTAIIPMHEALHTVLNGKLLTFFEEDKELVEDLYLGFGQLITLSKNQMSFIRNTRDAYSTIMTNTLNRVIKLFTSLTVILTVSTIIASFYGMNVLLPGATSVGAFPIILVITIIGVCSLIWYFNRKDWL